MIGNIKKTVFNKASIVKFLRYRKHCTLNRMKKLIEYELGKLQNFYKTINVVRAESVGKFELKFLDSYYVFSRKSVL